MISNEEDINEEEYINEVVNEVETEEPTPRGTALTINIQSWATPIVGLVLLFIGLAAAGGRQGRGR